MNLLFYNSPLLNQHCLVSLKKANLNRKGSQMESANNHLQLYLMINFHIIKMRLLSFVRNISNMIANLQITIFSNVVLIELRLLSFGLNLSNHKNRHEFRTNYSHCLKTRHPLKPLKAFKVSQMLCFPC